MFPTPGPWSVHPSIPGMVVDAQGGWLAHCPHGSRPETEAQARADARLIAASPALLHACHYALRFWEETGMEATWHPSIVQLLKAAIAQAEGRQP